MKTLLPILKTKLFLLGFVSACTIVLATTVPQIRNFIAPEKAIGEKITTEQKKIVPKIKKQNKTVSSSRVTSSVLLEMNNSYEATVQTNKGDYSPGDYVIITGSGWTPYETVNLNILSDCGCTNVTLTAEANIDGEIYNTEFLITEKHIGASFVLTATGVTSLQTAQTTFTDANSQLYSDVGRTIIQDAFAWGNTVYAKILSATDRRCYRILIKNPSGTTVQTIQSNAISGSGGSSNRDFQFTVPSIGPSGVWTVTVEEGTTNESAAGACTAATFGNATDKKFDVARAVIIGAVHDNFIRQDQANTIQQSSGTGTDLNVESNDGNNNIRALVQFNTSTIPAFSTISDAKLRMLMTIAPGSSRTYDAQRLNEQWNEGQVTWNNRLTSTAWTTPGGVVTGAPISQTTGTVNNTLIRWPVTVDLQSFVFGGNNFGWRIKDQSEETNPTRSGRFWSTEKNTATDLTFGPVLLVDYEECIPVSISATGATLTLGCNPIASDINAALGSATASDGCGTTSVTSSDAALQSSGCGRSQKRTFTATDQGGNTATTSRTATWTYDVAPPSGESTGGSTGTDACMSAAAGLFSFNATAAAGGYTDVCGSVVAIETGSEVVSGNNCGWTVTYTFKVVDDCGNELTDQTYTHTGSDQTAPSLTGSAYSQVGSVNTCKPTQPDAVAAFSSANALAGYSDVCSGTTLTAHLTNTVVSGTNCSWTITYTYDVKDECLNTLAGRTYTTVGADITAPSLTGAAYSQVGSVNTCKPTQPDAVTAFSSVNALAGYSDVCSGTTLTAHLTNTVVSGTNCSWTITYTYDVKDECLNTLTGRTYTTVGADITAPSLTGAAYSQAGSVNTCKPTQPDAVTAFSSVNALAGYSDVCSGTTLTAHLTNTVVSGTNCSWTITYTYDVKDECLNTLTGRTYTTVGADITAPSLTGAAYSQAGSVNTCKPTQPDAVTAFSSVNALAGYSDVCSGTTLTAHLTNTVVSGTNCSWTITYTYDVKDECLNTLTGRTYTTVGADITAPSLTGAAYSQAGSVNTCKPTQPDAVTAFSSANALAGYSDVCSGTTLTAHLTNTVVSGTNCSWTITYTYDVKDECLNTLTGRTYTTVGADITAPSLTGAAYSQVGSVNTCKPTQPDAVTAFSSVNALAGYSDVCSGTTLTAHLTNTVVSGTNCSWTITYTYDVKDECLNTLTGRTYTTVGADITAPSLTGAAYSQAGSVNTCKPTQPDAVTAFSSVNALAGYSDVCSGTTLTAHLTNTVVSGTNCSWTITYTYDVKDECLNTLTGRTYTTVGADITAPSLTGAAYSQAGSVNTCKPTQPDAVTAFSSVNALAGYSDVCSGTTLTAHLTNTVVSGTNCSWTITYTYDVKDECLNTLTGRTYTTVGADITAPSLTGAAYSQAGSVNTCKPTQPDAVTAFSSANALAGYSDVCSGTTLTAHLTNTVVSGTNCSWTITYTYDVKDECLNTLTGRTYTTVGADITAPSLTGAAYSQVGFVNSCKPTQPDAVSAFSSVNALAGYSDVCSGTTLTAHLTNTVVSGTNCSWTITYTYDVKDECLNTLTGRTYTTVGADITAPSLTGAAYSQAGSVNTCKPTQPDAVTAFSSANALAGYSDVCSGTTLTAHLTNTVVSGTNCSWTITYTYDVKDECLNTLTGRTYTTVGADITAPSLTGAAYSQVGSVNTCKPTQPDAVTAFSSVNALAGYSDVCSGTTLTAHLTNTVVSGTNCSWTITYTYDVKDECLNTLTGRTYTTVGADITAPSLTGAAYSQAGSVNTCKPTQPDAVTAFSSANALAGYSDVCSGTTLTAHLTNTVVSGTNCSWTITYTYDVKDECLNTLTGRTYTTVGADITAPSLTGAAYSQVGSVNTCKPTQPDAVTAFSSANALAGYSDVCSGTTLTAHLTNTVVSGTNCSWTITYTYDVKDECLNTLSGRTYTTAGADITAPSLTGAAYSQVGSVNTCKPTQPDAVTAFSSVNALAGYSDVCSGTTLTAHLTNTVVSGTNCSWTITYTYDVKDECLNTLTGRTYTTVGADITAPSLTGAAYSQAGSVNTCKPTQPDAVTAFSSVNALAGYSDVCSGTTLTAHLTNTVVSGTNCSWTITYTYDVKDECLNTLTGRTYTTVGADITAPSLTGAAYSQVGSVNTCKPTQPDAVSAFSSVNALAGYSDVCSGTTLTAHLTNTVVSGTNCSWTITYTYDVKDECLNTLTGRTYTTVGADITAPSLTGAAYSQAGSVNTCKPTQPDAVTAFSSANALAGYSDVCSGTTLTAHLTNTVVSGTNCSWTITYTYDVKDECLNTLTGRTYTTVGADITAPSLTGTAYSQVGFVNSCKPSDAAAAAAFSSANALAGYSDVCSGTTLTAVLTSTAVAGNNCSWTTTYTYSVKDACNNALTGRTYTTVGKDNTAPSLTGTAYSQVGFVNSCKPSDAAAAAAFSSANALAGYSDVCSGTTLTAVLTSTAVAGNNCSWTTTYTYTVKDACNNALTGRTYTTVGKDNTPPAAPSGTFVSQTCLWPPNHKMVDIVLATSSDNCGGAIGGFVKVVSNEPKNDVGDGNTSPDMAWSGSYEVDDYTVQGNVTPGSDGKLHIQLRAERSGVKALVTPDFGRTYTVYFTATDACGNSATTVSNQVMIGHNITSPNVGKSFKVGTTVPLAGTFWDVPGNTHTAKWIIDGISVNGAITAAPSGNKLGKVSGSYKPTAAGIYKLRMNVTDQKGVTGYATTNGDYEAFLVIYDPNGGYTFGGGKFVSPDNAAISHPGMTGKVAFGFASNYFKNSTNPKGETELVFKDGGVEFTALNYDVLVVDPTKSKATYKGLGKTIINGVEQSGYAFLMTVIDGKTSANLNGTDRIRIKIYNKNTGAIIYDNQPGAPDDADPIIPVDNPLPDGSDIVVVNTPSSTSADITRSSAQMEVTPLELTKFNVKVFPNPSQDQFSLYLEGANNDKVRIVVYDALGREVKKFEKEGGNIPVIFGRDLKGGAYFVEVRQGDNRKTVKLIKQN